MLVGGMSYKLVGGACLLRRLWGLGAAMLLRSDRLTSFLHPFENVQSRVISLFGGCMQSARADFFGVGARSECTEIYIPSRTVQ